MTSQLGTGKPLTFFYSALTWQGPTKKIYIQSIHNHVECKKRCSKIKKTEWHWEKGGVVIPFLQGNFYFLCTLFNTASSAALRFHYVRGWWDGPKTVTALTLAVRRSNHSARSHPHLARSLPQLARSHPQRLDIIHNRLALIHTWLDIIHTRLDLIHNRLDLIPNWLDLIHNRLDLIHTRLDLIHTRIYLIQNRLALIHTWLDLIHTQQDQIRNRLDIIHHSMEVPCQKTITRNYPRTRAMVQERMGPWFMVGGGGGGVSAVPCY